MKMRNELKDDLTYKNEKNRNEVWLALQNNAAVAH